MAKIRHNRFNGEIRNRYETKYNHQIYEHDNDGRIIRKYSHHHKNVRHHHRH